MIKAVLFDFGGVITTSPFEAFAAYERSAGLPADLIRTINATDPDTNAWAHFERGDLSRERFIELFEAEAASLGHQVDAGAVLDCLQTVVRPAMVSALANLTTTHKTAILTNNLAPTFAGSSGDGPTSSKSEAALVKELVDVVVESSVVGVRKPEVRFYEIACELLGVGPTECLFLDDLGINLKPARAMGMTTIKVTSGEQALAELEAGIGRSLA